MLGTAITGLTGLCALVLVTLVLRATPRAMLGVWTATLFLVPLWVGQTLGNHFFLSAITLITLVGVVAFGGTLRPTVADLLMVSLVFLVLVQFALGLVNLSNTVVTVLEWFLPYVWGRLLLSRVDTQYVTRCLATFAVIAASLAIVEFLTRTNLFTSVPFGNSLYTVWGPLQFRAGILRVEGAWGHSIALGAALAMSSPFVLAAPWKPWARIGALAVLTAATVFTFSRIGILTLIFSIALSVLLLPQIGRTVRIVVPAAATAATVAVVPFVDKIFEQAGTEAQGSAAYRSDLFSLFDYVRLFGSAPSFRGTTIGGTYLGLFANSTDNAVLLTGLRLGWFALVLFLVPLVLVTLTVLLPRRSTPASIAVAAQLPTLFVVALITQFGMYLWFLVGLALTWSLRARTETTQETPQPETVSTRGPGLPGTQPQSSSRATDDLSL